MNWGGRILPFEEVQRMYNRSYMDGFADGVGSTIVILLTVVCIYYFWFRKTES